MQRILIATALMAISAQSSWAAGSGDRACMREARIVCHEPSSTVASHRMHAARFVRRPFRSAYHIPRFDPAEAEAEVHVQYRYRTPYLPYWVFP